MPVSFTNDSIYPDLNVGDIIQKHLFELYVELTFQVKYIYIFLAKIIILILQKWKLQNVYWIFVAVFYRFIIPPLMFNVHMESHLQKNH